jgi:hypothetical protein
MHIYVTEDQFDKESGQVLKRHPNASDYNLLIGQARARANEIFVEYRLSNRVLTPDAFMNEFLHPEKKSDFLAFYEKQMNRRWSRNEIADSSRVTDLTVLKKLRMFKTHRDHEKGLSHERPITFQEIDLAWLEEFDLWHLRYLRENVGKKLKDNGKAPRWNAIKKIKTYLKLATQLLGITVNPSVALYKVQKPGDQKCALTLMQFKRLMVTYQSPGDLSFEELQVLRAFLFSCFTGLRYSDAAIITYEQVSAGTLTFQAWKTMRVKHEILSVPIPAPAMGYLEAGRIGGTIFRLKSNQRTNKLLKRIAEEAGMRGVRLTYKWSRDTFATLFLERGGAVEVLQKLMGHSKITDTIKYVTVTEERKRQQQKVWEGI